VICVEFNEVQNKDLEALRTFLRAFLLWIIRFMLSSLTMI